MSRGQADYGALAVKEVSASVSDMGEVAARLGSIVTYDKRGDVVDFDNFEEPVLKWKEIATRAGETPIFSSTYPKSGSQNVKLRTLAFLYDESGLRKCISILGSTSLGAEISFRELSEDNYLSLIFKYYTGSKRYEAEARIDCNTQKLEVKNSSSGYDTVISIGDITTESTVYFTMKLVCDFSTGKYVRLMFGNSEYDLSDKNLFWDEDNSPGKIDTSITLINQRDRIGYCWLDDFVLTQAEP